MSEQRQPGAPPAVQLNPLGRFGDRLIRSSSGLLEFSGDLAMVVVRGLQPGRWRRTMRDEFALYLRQIGIGALGTLLVAGLLVGVGLVLQIIYWLGVAGQELRVGEFLVLVLIREIAPLMSALIVIGRSGSVMLDEVGHLNSDGQIRYLLSSGIDPDEYIAIPRTFATAVALLVMTIVFLHLSLWSGYIVASLTGLSRIPVLEFIDVVLGGMTLADHLLLLVKPLLIGLIIGYLPVWLGMRIETGVLGVRSNLPKGFVDALIATFLIGTLVSALL